VLEGRFKLSHLGPEKKLVREVEASDEVELDLTPGALEKTDPKLHAIFSYRTCGPESLIIIIIFVVAIPGPPLNNHPKSHTLDRSRTNRERVHNEVGGLS
jgi:hypothetical protein